MRSGNEVEVCACYVGRVPIGAYSKEGPQLEEEGYTPEQSEGGRLREQGLSGSDGEEPVFVFFSFWSHCKGCLSQQ